MNAPFDVIASKNLEGTLQYRCFIDGHWQSPFNGQTFEVKNPATGESIGWAGHCSAPDVESALRAAKKYAGLKPLPPLKRLDIMEKARELVLEHQDSLAETITRESGKPISLSRGEVKSTAERLKVTLEETRVLYGEYLPGEWVLDTRNKFAIVLRRPLGVVAAISPFNYPLFIAAAKIIPALLAGNSVIAKPASDTPLSLLYFGRLLELAGVPAGALNILTGSGRSVGDAITTSPDVDAVSFTGSTSVGESIASKAGIKKLHLELGGNASAIVLEDADIGHAAVEICRGTFRNSGQRCDAVSRVLVHERVKDAFVTRVLEEARRYPTGNPMDPKTEMGTVINAKAAERIHSLVEDAVSSGAKALTGGTYRGLFYPATILEDVTKEMRVAREEIFGPVMPILTIRSAEEAVEVSNSSEYGLDACVFTENINLAMKISRELEDGSVTINAAPAHGIGHFPFGGNKKSGLGREGITYSIDELTKLHTIVFAERE